jgi:hypothetical protein
MYPQFTTEVAAQRRQALTAFADRRRLFGRRNRAAAADAFAVDTISLAHLVHLPVRLDGLLGEPVASASPLDARVA